MSDASSAAAKPYPLGVMFVHGIGEQPLGDTLKSVVDPIVRSLDLWIHGAARCRAVALGDAAANTWAKGMPGNDTAAREQAQQMAWSSEMIAAKLTATQAEDIAASNFYSGSALLCDGRVQAAGDGEAPPHAVLHVHTTDAHYKVTEGSALLAESWWAQSFVPPSPHALLSWTFKVLPMAVGMHLGDGVRRHGLRVAQGGGLPSRLWHAFLASLALAAMVVAVPLAMPLQALLVITVILSMIPLRVVQDAMRTLQSVLVGTLGDSFLLVSSPVSRAMIVAQCKRDMHWLANQASWFGDHTGYWRNVEEVVLPLALRISAALGVPVTKHMARDKRLLTGGRRRRHHRVCMLVILRWLFLAGSAAALWMASTQWLAFGNTLVDQGLAWVSPTGDFSIKVLGAALRERLPDLLLWIVVPYVVLMLAWRGWEEHEQRALLLRKYPNGLIEGLLTGLMVVATCCPPFVPRA